MHYRYELVADNDGPMSQPCRMSRSTRRTLLRAARQANDLFGRWRVVRVAIDDDGEELYRSFVGHFDSGIFRAYLTPRQKARRQRAAA